jgi:RNA polymerase sigma factor (sigma-70 family)
VSDPHAPSRHSTQGWFASTHWSLLQVAASGSDSLAQEALEKLCRQYWSPLFNYCRSRGLSHEDAEDQVQQFFARFLAKTLFSRADRDRGRFRTFLLAALKNFLANEWEKASAQKRGGGERPLSLDAESPEGEKLVQEPADDRTAVQAYEFNWALALLENARTRLVKEFDTKERQERFRCLEQFLPGAENEMTYAEAAARLGVPEGTVKSDVHRLKVRYRKLLRDEIGRTVSQPSEIDEELRHLMSVLARPNR